MKGRLLFLLIVLLVTRSTAFSQPKNPGKVSGILVDSLQKHQAEGATITVLSQVDSSVVAFALTAKDGSFSMENLPLGHYFLKISFKGYATLDTTFALTPEKSQLNLAHLYLVPEHLMLGEVVVKSPPVVINGDTTEFKADHFKTIPNATVEDLLKKLPGTEVEKDGTITSQGQQVTRVLVDGKRFFSDDPKIATRNLPADVIDKVQMIDARSEQSEFTGFDDGERVRTINIITKKDRRKGVFGKGSLAAGSKERMAGAMSANRFNGNQQMSFILQGNNINSQNFSVQDFLGNMNAGNSGGRGRGGNIFSGGNTGIATTRAGGMNYNDVWSAKTAANGSYFYNHVDMENNRDRFRETFVASDSSLFNTNHFSADNANTNHRFNFEIDHRFDSASSVLFRPSYNYQETDNYSVTNSYTTRGKMIPLNEITSNVATQSSGYNQNNQLLFRHRFKKRGRTFSVNFTQGSNTMDRSTSNRTYSKKQSGAIDTLDQVSTTSRKGLNYAANFSLSERLGEKSQVELTYNRGYNKNQSDQQTYRLNKASGKHEDAVPNLTNLFDNSNASQRAGVSYRMQLTPQWNYMVGMAVQHATLKSNNITKSTYLDHSFTNLFPSFMIQYRKPRSGNLRFSYRGSTQQPNINQLQDVVDNSNVLHIRSGNPGLQQEFNNNFNFSFNTFNPTTFRNFSIGLNGSSISQMIATAITINTTSDTILVDGFKLGPGAQYSKPENIDGFFTVGGNVQYGFPLKNPKSNVNISTRFNYEREVNKVNAEKAFTHNYIVGGSLRYNMNIKDKFDLNFSSNSTFNLVQYSTDSRQSSRFFSQRFSIEPTYMHKKGWIISNDFDYVINRGQAAGFNQAVPLWNASVARQFMKKKQAELRLTMFDLLNQNRSFTRNVEQNYVEDVRSEVLNQYFLLSFTYHLRNFKGPAPGRRNNNEGQNRDRSPRRSPGMDR